VVSSADNVIRPFFISGRARIATLPVFLGLIGGLSAFPSDSWWARWW
jgi:predicted PurR-regulated permease PerM